MLPNLFTTFASITSARSMAHRSPRGVHEGRERVFSLMPTQEEPGLIRWRVHFKSAPDRVYRMLATPEGRRLFWAVSAEETRGEITFEFVSGQRLSSRVLEAVAPRRYALTYFAGSHVTFELLPDGGGGTDLTLTEWNVLDDALAENIAAWVSVLLHLKAAADFGVDLRNHDPKRGWHHGYVDV